MGAGGSVRAKGWRSRAVNWPEELWAVMMRESARAPEGPASSVKPNAIIRIFTVDDLSCGLRVPEGARRGNLKIALVYCADTGRLSGLGIL